MPEPTKPVPGRAWLIKLLLAAVVVFVAGLFVLRGVDVRHYWDEGMAVIQRAGPWFFFVGMAVLPAVGAPLSFFVLPAGPAFSGQIGLGGVIAACGAAMAVNLALTYWIARYALRPMVERLVTRLGYHIPQVDPGEQIEVTLLLRITPGPPFLLQSYLLVLGGVKFAKFLAISWAVVMAQAVGVIVFGDALVHGKARLAVFGVSLVIAAAIVVHLVRKHLGGRRGRRRPGGAAPDQGAAGP